MALNVDQVRNVFDLWASTYDDTITAAEWGFEHYDDGLAWICKYLEPRMSCGRVIDLGCGTGVLGERLQRRFPFVEYIGVDISPNMLQIAKVKVPKMSYLKADLRDLNVWGRYLDSGRQCSVVSTYALHHVDDEDKVRVIEQVFSVSKQQDLLFLIVDYAFLDAGERNRMFNEQIILGNNHILEEIRAEHYADLSAMNKAFLKSFLDVSFERNGIWDWRIAIRRCSKNPSPPRQNHRTGSPFGDLS